MAKHTVKNPVQKGRLTIEEAHSAARDVKAKRSAVNGRYVTLKNTGKK